MLGLLFQYIDVMRVHIYAIVRIDNRLLVLGLSRSGHQSSRSIVVFGLEWIVSDSGKSVLLS